jgi:hypothetical protein
MKKSALNPTRKRFDRIMIGGSQPTRGANRAIWQSQALKTQMVAK